MSLKVISVVLLTGALAAMSACDSNSIAPASVAATGCSTGLAQIAVGDGYLEILCGCNEAGGSPVGAPANITCTVPANTTVMFQYLGTALTHQIVSSGGLSFPSSPPSVPGDPSEIHTAAVQFTAAGTYDFEDAYDGALQGKIVVE